MVIGSGVNLVMTVIGFAVSTMFIVFVCTRLICARIQLSASRRSFLTAAAATRSDLSVLQHGLHGLEPGLVANFPSTKYEDMSFSTEDDAQCTICLAEYQEKDVLRILPYCGHAFHLTCIDMWLQQHSTCPVCRISLRDSLERKHLLLPLYSAPTQNPIYTSETFDSNSYHHYPYDGLEYSAGTFGDQGMGSTQGNDFSSPVTSEAVDTVSTLSEVGHTVKDARQQASGV